MDANQSGKLEESEARQFFLLLLRQVKPDDPFDEEKFSETF